MSVIRISRIFIDADECTAHTLCEPELSTNVITFEDVDDGKYEVGVLHQNRLPRTKESLLSMLAAADVCPMQAFYIELSDGTVLNVWSDFVQKKIKSGSIEWE